MSSKQITAKKKFSVNSGFRLQAGLISKEINNKNDQAVLLELSKAFDPFSCSKFSQN